MKATIFCKNLGYAATRAQEIHTARFGFKGFQVLWVTSGGEGRVANIAAAADAARSQKEPPKLFLVASEATISAHASIFDVPWRNAAGMVSALEL